MPIDVNSEMTEMLKLSNKHFKVALVNIIQEVRLNIFETNKKTERLRRKDEKYIKRTK